MKLRDGPFKRIIQTISYLPHFLSWIVLGGMIINWLSTTGLLNQILMAVGLVDNPTNFLLDSGKYWWIASLSDTWKEAGWGTVLYLATMAGIDPTYYEAGKNRRCRQTQTDYKYYAASYENDYQLKFYPDDQWIIKVQSGSDTCFNELTESGKSRSH